MIAIVLVLISAAVEALSNVLQHKATNSIKSSGSGGEAKAVLATLKKPLFLLGFSLMVLGFGFHIASLGFGQNVAVIQVIFVSQVVFILPFAAWISKAKISGYDWLGALVITVGIGMFMVFSYAPPHTGRLTTTGSQWLVGIGVTSAICLIAILIGYRFVGAARAALIGVAGGVMNGLVAVLITGTLDRAKDGVGPLLGNWLIWTTLVAALLGVLFPLMAFRSGPITASFPCVMALNPITAAFLGELLFDQNLPTGAVHVTMMLVSGVILIIGIVWLSRSKVIADSFEEAEKGTEPGAVTESATML